MDTYKTHKTLYRCINFHIAYFCFIFLLYCITYYEDQAKDNKGQDFEDAYAVVRICSANFLKEDRCSIYFILGN